MQRHQTCRACQAHSQLAIQLCDALSAFVASTAIDGETIVHSPSPPANDDPAPQLTTFGYDDIISLRGILLEFGLKQPQVMTLRKTCGFPEPIGPTRPLMFRRDEVEQWVRVQSNLDVLAMLTARGRIGKRAK